MKVFKKVSTGFFIFVLLYALLVIFVPLALDFMNIEMNVKMQIFSLELGEIVNNSREMYGALTIYGLLLSGLVGALINILLYYMFKSKTSRLAR
ncbi:hypothetical protein [Bacillus suaedae]|uniref:Uncharacterized protein n=1 Tax=Halalkalibacter suaedae TaxID=2822140 RepID=A0A940WXR1_9BACI|nr:hypothetical protein [Bacillus suaedae]MBP3950265.1 hypothetical protein [Bacillus suaedae]